MSTNVPTSNVVSLESAREQPVLALMFSIHSRLVHDDRQAKGENCSPRALWLDHHKFVHNITGDTFTERDLHAALTMHLHGSASPRARYLAEAELINPVSGRLTDLGGYTLYYLEHPADLDATVHTPSRELMDYISENPRRDLQL